MHAIPSFFQTPSALSSGSVLLWGLFGLLLIYVIVHGAVFWYHWNRYNIASPSFKRITVITYFSGTLILLFAALISLTTLLS